MTDEIARELALTRWGLRECLHVPIAAVDETAITRHVGDIVRSLSPAPAEALLVRTKGNPEPDDRYPIWRMEASAVFRSELHVWVNVAYTRYRSAYRRAFPEEAIAGKVLSHAMNRRVPALKGFRYVRVNSTSRRANSSSSFSEGWGVAFHSDRDQMTSNRRLGASIQYADLTELMLMLDMNLGGGFMDAVNEGQKLVRLAVTINS
jgi:hypothetical protein